MNLGNGLFPHDLATSPSHDYDYSVTFFIPFSSKVMKGENAYDAGHRNLQGHGLRLLRPLVWSQPREILPKNLYIAAPDWLDMVLSEDGRG